MSDTNIYMIVIMVGVVFLSLPPRSALETFGELKTNCPAYVREGFDMSCECFVDNTNFSANVNWNIPGGGYTLKLQNVLRKDNGTTYTCNGEWGSPPSRDSVTYTLLVAFGPDSVKMSFNATEPIVTNGTVQVALSCHAGDVYPAANYTWTGVTCVNKDHTSGTCIFTPRVPEDDGRQVSCSVHNVIFTRLTKSDDSKLTLTYPPMSPPEITRDIDTLTCRVKGGNPKVSSVTFFCGDEPERPDVVDDVSVASSVVIDVHQQHSNITCQCSATWAPQPGMYPHRVVIPLNGIDPPTSPPEITRNIDILTCRVKGGNPKVSSVNFFCDNQPDRPDVVDDVSVSSSVVIDVHQQHSNITCQCSATWAPQPGMYPHKVVIPVNRIDSGSSSSQEDKTQLPVFVGVGLACVVLVLIIIVVIACFIKLKRSRKYSFL